MSTTAPHPNDRATAAEMRRLWDLAVAVRRTIPQGTLTSGEANALIAEFCELPKLGPIAGAPGSAIERKRAAKIHSVRGRGYRRQSA